MSSWREENPEFHIYIVPMVLGSPLGYPKLVGNLLERIATCQPLEHAALAFSKPGFLCSDVKHDLLCGGGIRR